MTAGVCSPPVRKARDVSLEVSDASSSPFQTQVCFQCWHQYRVGANEHGRIHVSRAVGPRPAPPFSDRVKLEACGCLAVPRSAASMYWNESGRGLKGAVWRGSLCLGRLWLPMAQRPPVEMNQAVPSRPPPPPSYVFISRKKILMWCSVCVCAHTRCC